MALIMEENEIRKAAGGESVLSLISFNSSSSFKNRDNPFIL
jgi:hypothetical protein